MKLFKKALAVILTLSIVFCLCPAALGSGVSGVVSAPSKSTAALVEPNGILDGVNMDNGFGAAFIKASMNCLNAVMQTVIKAFCAVYPNPGNWKSIDEYTGENYLPGRETYSTSPAENAEWSLGYSSASVIPEDFEAGKYYIGRKLNVVSFDSSAKVQDVLDDQRVRAVCVDDGSGEGAVVIAVVDGIGLSSTTVRSIRAKLSDYVTSGKIASINISATHAHSCIDTQGVSTSFLYTLFGGIFNNFFKRDEKLPSANDSFMENLIDVSAATIAEAYEGMEKGILSYSTADGSKYIYDKRDFIDYVPEIGILHFDPSDNGNDTYIVNMTCHPTSFSFKNTSLSSDYVYYMDKKFIDSGSNFILVQGAVGQVSKNSADIEIDESLGDVADAVAFGEKMADVVKSAAAEPSELLQPVLNAVHTEVFFTTSNYLLQLACEARLVDNEAYTTGIGVNDVTLPSEVGYLEFGHRVAFGLYPAELYPEVFHGGAATAENSWDGSEWGYAPMPEMVADGIDLYAVSFANDTIGYVVTDNYYASLGHIIEVDEQYELWGKTGLSDELLSAGKNTASTIVETFKSLVDGLGAAPVKN